MTKAKPVEKSDKNIIDNLTNLATSLLEKMGTKAQVSTSKDAENDAYLVNIKSPDESGLIIGNRGKTLNSIQYILGIMLRNFADEWNRVLVDVSDWREKEEQKLSELAENTALRVKETGEPQQLYNLTASQRRIIHMALSKDDKITTESKGEGRDRYLVVTLKK